MDKYIDLEQRIERLESMILKQNKVNISLTRSVDLLNERLDVAKEQRDTLKTYIDAVHGTTVELGKAQKIETDLFITIGKEIANIKEKITE